MKPLNLNQQRFVAELFAVSPFNATAAYMRANPGLGEPSAAVHACNLMKDERVKAEIAKWQNQLRTDLELTAADIVKELALLASADPRELSEHYLGACRFCHGDNFRYQRTPSEFKRDLESHIAARKGDKERGPDPYGLEFDLQGGVGFNPKRGPHPDCPECFGEGIGYEVFKDTRTLSPGAARLYDGVKRTRDGLELKTRSRDKALELAGQRLGMFKTGHELSGPGGGAIPIASVSSVTTDPIEASRLYQKLVGG